MRDNLAFLSLAQKMITHSTDTHTYTQTHKHICTSATKLMFHVLTVNSQTESKNPFRSPAEDDCTHTHIHRLCLCGPKKGQMPHPAIDDGPPDIRVSYKVNQVNNVIR